MYSRHYSLLLIGTSNRLVFHILFCAASGLSAIKTVYSSSLLTCVLWHFYIVIIESASYEILLLYIRVQPLFWLLFWGKKGYVLVMAWIYLLVLRWLVLCMSYGIYVTNALVSALSWLSKWIYMCHCWVSEVIGLAAGDKDCIGRCCCMSWCCLLHCWTPFGNGYRCDILCR